MSALFPYAPSSCSFNPLAMVQMIMTDDRPADRNAPRVIHVDFRPRVRPQDSVNQPFVLEASDGQWTLKCDTGFDAERLVSAAHALREIARDLIAKAHAVAGQPLNPCIAEIVMYADGGVDHWFSAPQRDAHRPQVARSLQNVIASLREEAS